MSFSGTVKMAWRNLWRNPRRTGILLLTIIIGSWSMIFFSALMRGMVTDMFVSGVDRLPGHVQVHHADYFNDPSVDTAFANPDQTLLAALDDEAIERWGLAVKLPVMINSEYENRGVTLVAAAPSDRIWLQEERIVEGALFTSEQDKGLIIGRALAKKLDTRLGKRVVLSSQDRNGELAERGLRVIGLYSATSSAQEESTIFMSLPRAQKFLKMDAMANELSVLLRNDDDEEVARIQSKLQSAAADLEVKRWDEIDPFLAAVVNTSGSMTFIITVIIFIALSFGFLNTVLMAIFERTREIGLMGALGVRPRTVVFQIMLETAMLLLLGMLIGNVVAVLSLQLMSDGISLSGFADMAGEFGMSPSLVPDFRIQDIIVSDAMVVGLGTLATLIPARRAAKVDPVNAMNSH